MSVDLSKSSNSETLSKDTGLLCGTKHKVWVGLTGEKAYEDKIKISATMQDTGGGLTTNYHFGNGYLHKLRIEILNDGKIVHQEDITGDDTGKSIEREYLINAPGNWVVRFKSKSSGDCAKPTGTKEVGYFTALEPATKDDANGQDNAGDAGQAPKPKTDYSNLAKTGLILGAALVVGKIISKKDKKAAELIRDGDKQMIVKDGEAPKPPSDNRKPIKGIGWGTGQGRIHLVGYHGRGVGCNKKVILWDETQEEMTVQEVKDTDFGMCSFCNKKMWLDRFTE